VRIQDTGIGMSRDDISRIFEPFYSKKKMGRSGSGLGLAVVYGVIQDHHAYIDVTSREQGGTTFDLYFQRTRSTQISRKEAAMTKPGSESILVVDDNASQRKLADRLLSALGYSTACVSTGKDAVEYLKRSEVDLIVLDMVLEDSFDGLDTFKAIREFKPEQKFIVASGYSESDRSNELKTLGCRQYINKPYSPQTLSQAIRAELDGSDIDQ
jgi:CheY-like chemotaxis protein